MDLSRKLSAPVRNTAPAVIGWPVPLHQETLLQVSGLTKTYPGQTALADVSFDIRQHEILGLIGPNGAGKTTLLEGMAGLLPVDSGIVTWQGTALPPARRRSFVFYLPDGVRPWQDQYVTRVLAFFGGVYRRSERHIAGVVDAVGLGPALSKRVLALSKGYMRRLIWALALLAPHPLLLMDEPFDGFDLKQTREMMPLLRALSDGGRTLVLSIHQLRDAQTICDRFVLLSGGRICGIGTLDELRARTTQASGGLEEVFLALT
jgi:ABC-type multidrug transport system ATPase subunit